MNPPEFWQHFGRRSIFFQLIVAAFVVCPHHWCRRINSSHSLPSSHTIQSSSTSLSSTSLLCVLGYQFAALSLDYIAVCYCSCLYHQRGLMRRCRGFYNSILYRRHLCRFVGLPATHNGIFRQTHTHTQMHTRLHRLRIRMSCERIQSETFQQSPSLTRSYGHEHYHSHNTTLGGRVLYLYVVMVCVWQLASAVQIEDRKCGDIGKETKRKRDNNRFNAMWCGVRTHMRHATPHTRPEN